jgi:WG containing repeat
MSKLFLTGFIFLNFFYSFSQQPRILVPFRLGNKWGYSDTLGKIKIEPKYDSVSLFNYERSGNDVIANVVLKGKPMVINDKGKTIVPPKYDEIRIISVLEGLHFYVFKNNKWGVFENGKELIAPIYDYLNVEPGVQYRVGRNNNEGLIDSKGKLVIPVNYFRLFSANSNKPGFMQWIGYKPGVERSDSFMVKIENGYGSAYGLPPTEQLESDVSRNEVNQIADSLKMQYSLDSTQVRFNIIIAYKNRMKGVFVPGESKSLHFFSKDYNIHVAHYLLPYQRNNTNKNSAAFIVASLNGHYGMINEKEEEILPFVYDNIEDRSGFYILKRNQQIGFLVTGTIYPFIEPQYDEWISLTVVPVNSRWNFDLFKIKKNGRGGFVGENGVNYFRD